MVARGAFVWKVKKYYFCDMFGNSRGGNWPPVTKNLIIINVLLWVVVAFFPGSVGNVLYKHLGLHYITSGSFNPVQIFTYMFMHDQRSILHLAFNMFSLWMFGRILENVWGSQRFLFFYIVCGVGAALIQEGFWALTWEHDYISDIAKLNGMTYESMKEYIDAGLAAGNPQVTAGMEYYKTALMTVGASGSIFGLLLGFAFVFPNMPLYLFFIPVPIRAKYMVIGYAVLEFFFGVGGKLDSVAHFAHLGGMLFGLILLLYWKKKGTLGGGSFY